MATHLKSLKPLSGKVERRAPRQPASIAQFKLPERTRLDRGFNVGKNSIRHFSFAIASFPSLMNIIVFEDAGVDQLYPITSARPAYSILCATYRLNDWFSELGDPIRAIVRPYLRALQILDRPHLTKSLDNSQSETLVLNARLVPSANNIAAVKQFAETNRPRVARFGEQSVAAAIIPSAELNDQSDDELLNSIYRYLARTDVEVDSAELRLFDYPHDVVRENLATFSENMEHRLAVGQYNEIAEGVFVSGTVTVSDFVVTNTNKGPIIIEDGSVIGPFCFLRGPVHIGRNCRINEHSAIKDEVSTGHTIKIGGEVEGSIIEDYSNKQHHGFLGHSYLGSWINLGAGTCNSDLKNTYGIVNMDYNGERVSTGMQFIGCIMGDYAKTAINTSIFTGKLIGPGSMLYGFVTTNVPAFVNYARSFGQVTESPPGILELTQKRMFSRRNVPQRPADIQLIHDLYDLTRDQRQLSEEPLNL